MSGPPSLDEISALADCLRAFADARSDAADRAAYLADQRDLVDRIAALSTDAEGRSRSREEAQLRQAADSALSEVALARAADGGYRLVGPSARTWRVDPTGRAEPAPEAEHRAVQELIAREQLDATEPVWTQGPDGQLDVLASVVLVADDEPLTFDVDPLDEAQPTASISAAHEDEHTALADGDAYS